MISRVSWAHALRSHECARPDAVYPYAPALAHRNPRVGHMGIEIRGGPGAHKRHRLTKRLRALTLLPRDSRLRGHRENLHMNNYESS
jgi:hypothetical protein